MGRPKAPGGAGYCFVGLGSGGGVGDNRFAVADDDVLVGERLQLNRSMGVQHNRRHGIASAQAMCPSKPSVLAMSL